MSIIDSFSALLISVTKDRKTNYFGISLIELMLVIFMIATLSAIAIPAYSNYIDKAKNIRAIAEIRILEKEIQDYKVQYNDFPDTLSDIGRGNLSDPWGNPYQYLNIAKITGKGGKDKPEPRKDRWEVPLNSDFDLYSMGKDGKSIPTLRAKASWDDIVRASDGGYVGLASEYS